MAARHPAWRAWLARLGWFAAGVLAHAVLTAEESEPQDAAAANAPHVGTNAEPEPEPKPEPKPEPELESDPESDPESESDPDPVPVPVPESAPVPAPESAPGRAPAFPLPRMPGTRRLRSTATPSDDGRGWVLVHALRIPAKPEQVEAFYRKALEDQGMRVAVARNGSDHRHVSLRGRSRRAHADVAIMGRKNRVETSVNILLRTYR